MAYQALYREWRPRTFGEIIGQEHITRTLKNAVESGRVGHAYLFCGTRGTGKTTTAKVFTKALNCPDREGAEPCNRCSSCTAINEGLSVDVIEVDAASNRGIDEIRDLREKIKFAPAAGNFRIYIIDEVHMLTHEAFNALLKTLEEPPRQAMLILATTEPHKIPLTILSRCQRFDFRRIVPSDIIQRLKEVIAGAKLEAEEEALRLIARAAEGGLRDALSILDQAASFGGMKVTAGDVHNILGTVRVDALSRMAGYLAAASAGPALTLVAELTKEGKDLRLFAREMAGYLRALLLDKLAPGASAAEVWDDPAQMANLAAEFSKDGLLRVVELIAAAEQDMKWSTMPGVILELALVKACRAEVRGDMTALYSRLEAVEEKLKSHTGLKGKTMVTREAQPGENKPLWEKSRPAKAPVSPAQAAGPSVAKNKPAGSGVARDTPVERPQRQEQGIKDPASDSAGEVTLEQVKGAWSEIINVLRKERLPLYHNYTKAFPLTLRGRGLVIGFPEEEALAREMAGRPDHKKYLEELMGKFFDGKWQVAFTSYQGRINLPEKDRAARAPVVDVKKRFGGEEIILDDDSEGTLF